MHGQPYVPGDDFEQTLHLHLICSQDAGDPKLMSYNGSQVQVEWSTPAGCGHSSDEPNQDDKNGSGGSENVGSGIGWFFLVYVHAFQSCFGFCLIFYAQTFVGFCGVLCIGGLSQLCYLWSKWDGFNSVRAMFLQVYYRPS